MSKMIAHLRSRTGKERAQLAALALVAVGLIVWAGLELVSPSYDPLYSLAWGQTIADGKKPELLHELAPLAHPLPIAVGAVLSLLGPAAAYDLFTIIAAFSYALMAFGAYRLVQALLPDRKREAAIGAGILAVVLILTRVRIDFFALKGTVEVPFTALLLLALAHVIEDPRRRPWVPLALLGLAGLLRPESWALGVGYLAWLAYDGLRGRGLAACAALAAAPIVGWLIFAGALTGDPLSPITGNPAASDIETLGFRPPAAYESGFWLSETADVIDAAVDNVRAMLGDELAIFTLLTMMIVLLPLVNPERRTPERLRIAGLAALIIVLTVQSMVLAELGAPLVERYVFPIVVLMVAMICAGLFMVAEGRTALVAGVVLLALVTTGALSGHLPDWPTLAKVRQKIAFSVEERDEHELLYRLTSVQEIRRAVRPCNKVKIGGRGGVYAVLFAKPLIAHGLERDPELVSAERSPRGKLTASNFRRKLPHGPEPYIKEEIWVFRSPCLKEDYLTRGLAQRRLAEKRRRLAEKRKRAVKRDKAKAKKQGAAQS